MSTRVKRKLVDVVGKRRSCLMIRSRAELGLPKFSRDELHL